MSPDDYLERLLDAIESNDYSNIESYAKKILGNIGNIKSNLREDLKGYLQGILDQIDNRKRFEKEKSDLIDKIMQPK